MNIRMLPLKIKALLKWPFEIGRVYTNESPDRTFRRQIKGKWYSVTVRYSIDVDAFTLSPNLRAKRGQGVILSYKSWWGMGPIKRVEVVWACMVHDVICMPVSEGGLGARDDYGQDITFEIANLWFYYMLQDDGYRTVAEWYYAGVSGIVAKAFWNSHKDGRMPA